jgi:hypothetical protein
MRKHRGLTSETFDHEVRNPFESALQECRRDSFDKKGYSIFPKTPQTLKVSL